MNFDTPELLEAIEQLSRGNYSAAVKTLKPLAAAGNPKAQCNLATCYQSGWGVELDVQEAVRLYEIVAKQSIQEGYLSATACNNLAGIYFCGAPGVLPDHQRAAEYRALSRSLRFPMAL
jgi:TPR repeat protein